MNSRLGYGGLVVSAQSENVAFLLRALAENHRVEVLQRPQIMTLDNQPAFIQVGKRVPRVTGVTVAVAGGQTSAVTLDNVGLILGVTPRISPDGLVVMQLDSEKSELESLDTGVPIYSSGNQVIRSPIIDATTAQTTVAAMSDQTVVLGGLITKSTNQVHRSVPVLGDIPLLGNLFRFDGTTTSRSELLIIMTPHIVKNEADAEKLKRAEAAKMNWCMCDVIKIYGDAGLRGRGDEWTEGEVPTIFPDEQPTGQPLPIEPIPTPSGTPSQPSAGGRGLRSPAPSPAPPPSDPSAAMQYGALQQVEYQAMPNPAVAPPAGNQPGAWQPAGAAQPAVYQAPPPAPPQGYFQPPAAPPVARQAIPTVYYR
jgi:hypothetical protein